MDRRRSSHLTVLCAAAALAGACAPGWQGRTPIRASSLGQGLTSALPAETPIPAVVAAARDVLGERGLVVTESSSTLDHGRVLARPGYTGAVREVSVTVDRARTNTRLRVAAGWGEGEAIERDVMEKILTRLAL